jgi:hypothetical protein
LDREQSTTLDVARNHPDRFVTLFLREDGQIQMAEHAGCLARIRRPGTRDARK